MRTDHSADVPCHSCGGDRTGDPAPECTHLASHLAEWQEDHWWWLQVWGTRPEDVLRRVSEHIPLWYQAIEVFQLRREQNWRPPMDRYTMCARWVLTKAAE